MLQFLEGDLSEDVQFSFEPSIYNTTAHLNLQSQTRWKSFFCLDEKLIRAAVHFNLDEGIAKSPWMAPFGGVEFENRFPIESLKSFLGFVSQQLRDLGIGKIELKQSPFLNAGSLQAFLDAGFTISLTEKDSFIEVGDDYEDQLHHRKSQKLRSLRNYNFKVQELNLDQLPQVYHFLAQTRLQKGYHLSMSLSQVQELAAAFPKRIFLFSVNDEEKIAAASLCILVKKSWLYDFYHDHDAAYNADSPLILLMDFIYNFAKKNSIEWIELGTSMSGTKVNEGLLDFKIKLGAITMSKFTLVKFIK